MRTLYESLLGDENENWEKFDKYAAQRKMIDDIGFLEFNPANSQTNNWLKNLNIRTDYTDLFEPYVKKQKNVFKKYHKEYSGLIGIILNILLEVKNSHREIYVWDYLTSTGPRPDGLIYLEDRLKKSHRLDLQIDCADMVDNGSLVLRLEFYDVNRGTFFYLYFDEDKFDKYIN